MKTSKENLEKHVISGTAESTAAFLMHTFLNDESDDMHEFAKSIYDVLHTPLIVFDSLGKVMLASGAEHITTESWMQTVERGYCAYAMLSFLHKLRMDGKIEPALTRTETPSGIIYACSVSHHSDVLGLMLLPEVHSSSSVADSELISLIAELAGKAIHRFEEKARAIIELSEDYIFLECLTGEYDSYDRFLYRVKNTAFGKKAQYVLLVIDVTAFPEFDPKKYTLKQYFAELFPASWMLWYRGNVVLIADISSTNDYRAVITQGEAYFRSNQLRGGISDIFTDIFYIRDYYRQALTAVRLSGQTAPNISFAYYNDYRTLDLIDRVAQQPSPEKYVDLTVIKVKEYDTNNKTDYCQTIKAYLGNNKSMSETSSQLGIHSNTVLYRLKKIKELFNLDFGHMSDNFQVMCSLILLDRITYSNREHTPEKIQCKDSTL